MFDIFRFYIFNEEKIELILFLEFFFYEYCVLKVCCLKRECGLDFVIYILFVVIDGCIVFWKVNKKDIYEIVKKFL